MRMALALLLIACGETPPPADPPISALPEIGPLDGLARRLGRVERRLENRGYGSASVTTRLFALEGRGVAVPLDLPRDACTTLVTLGGGNIRELELTLFDAQGREAAIDAAPGEAGLVHVCAPASTAGRDGTAAHHLVARPLVGDGAIVLAAFSAPAEAGEGFDGLFDGILAPVAPHFDAEGALAEVRAGLRERGLRPETEAVFATLAEGQARRAPLHLEAGRCYVVAARSGEGIIDVDLYLYDEGGAEVARDLGGDAAPRVEHCPSRSGRGTLEVRVFEGAGAVGWVVWSGEDTTPETPQPIDTPPVTAEPFAALAAAAAPLVARGYGEPIFLVRDASIGPTETRSHEVALAPGCSLILGTAGPGEVDLDLYLATDEGIVDRDTRVRRTAQVAACVDQRRARRITVKSYGRGEYALAIIAAPAAVTELAHLRAEPIGAALERRGFTLVSEESVRSEALGEPRPVRSGCVAVVAAGGNGVDDLDLLVRDGEAQLLSADTGPEPWAVVERCSEGNSDAAWLEIVPFAGTGPVLLQWFER